MTENVKAMMENFMFYHNQGKSIQEIAEVFKITGRTVYERLGEIARNNNVSRESLLQIPHKQHKKPVITHSRKKHSTIEKEELKQEEVVHSLEDISKSKKSGELITECENMKLKVDELLKVIENCKEKYRRN